MLLCKLCCPLLLSYIYVFKASLEYIFELIVYMFHNQYRMYIVYFVGASYIILQYIPRLNIYLI